MPRAARTRKLDAPGDWIDGSEFPFEKVDVKKRASRRESIAPNKFEDKTSKNKRKSMMLKRLELPEDSVASLSVTSKTRRQSMVTLNAAKSSRIARATSEKTIKGRASKSSLIQANSQLKKEKSVGRLKPPSGKITDKPAPKRRQSMAQMELQKISPVAVKTTRSAKPSGIPTKKSELTKTPKKSPVSKAVKNTKKVKTAKTPTKNKSKIKIEAPVTESTVASAKSARGRKRKVEESSSPVLKNLVTSAKKSAKKLNLGLSEDSLMNNSLEGISHVPVEPKSKRPKPTFSCTPRHEDPSNIVRQSWRKKATTEMRQYRINRSPNTVTESPKVGPTTPVSRNDLPPTPTSTRSYVSRRSLSQKGEVKMSPGESPISCPLSSTPIYKMASTNTASIRNLSKMLEETDTMSGEDSITSSTSEIDPGSTSPDKVLDEEKPKSRCHIM